MQEACTVAAAVADADVDGGAATGRPTDANDPIKEKTPLLSLIQYNNTRDTRRRRMSSSAVAAVPINLTCTTCSSYSSYQQLSFFEELMLDRFPKICAKRRESFFKEWAEEYLASFTDNNNELKMQFVGDALRFCGLPPLHAAAKTGNIPAIRWLLQQKGVDVDRALPYSNATALHFAVDSGQEEAVDVLLAAGADPFQLACAFRRTTYDFGPYAVQDSEEGSSPEYYLPSELARTKEVRAILDKHRRLRLRTVEREKDEEELKKMGRYLERAYEELEEEDLRVRAQHEKQKLAMAMEGEDTVDDYGEMKKKKEYIEMTTRSQPLSKWWQTPPPGFEKEMEKLETAAAAAATEVSYRQ